MVARLGKLGAEEIEFGLKCGDFVSQDIVVMSDSACGFGMPVGRICRAVARAVLSDPAKGL